MWVGDPLGEIVAADSAAVVQKRFPDQRFHDETPVGVCVAGVRKPLEQFFHDQFAGGAEGGVQPAALADQEADLTGAEAAQSPDVLVQGQAAPPRAAGFPFLHRGPPGLGLLAGEMSSLWQLLERLQREKFTFSVWRTDIVHVILILYFLNKV